MATLNSLMSAFGVVSAVNGGTMSATQHLTRDLADHRGRAPGRAQMPLRRRHQSAVALRITNEGNDVVGDVRG